MCGQRGVPAFSALHRAHQAQRPVPREGAVGKEIEGDGGQVSQIVRTWRKEGELDGMIAEDKTTKITYLPASCEAIA